MKDFIAQVSSDIEYFKKGYGNCYTSITLDEIQKLRAEICEKLQEANDEEKVNLNKLLYDLDNDSTIKAKKGL